MHKQITMQMLISAEYSIYMFIKINYILQQSLNYLHRIKNHFKCSIKGEKSIKLLSPAEYLSETNKSLVITCGRRNV